MVVDVQKSCPVTGSAEHSSAFHTEHCMHTERSPSAANLLQAAFPLSCVTWAASLVQAVAYLQSLALQYMLRIVVICNCWSSMLAGPLKQKFPRC